MLGERPVWPVTGIDWLRILAIVSLHHSLRLVQILLRLLTVQQRLIRSELIIRLLGHHCSVCHVPCQDRVRLLELTSTRKYMCSLNLRRGARHSATAGYILCRTSCRILRFFCQEVFDCVLLAGLSYCHLLVVQNVERAHGEFSRLDLLGDRFRLTVRENSAICGVVFVRLGRSLALMLHDSHILSHLLRSLIRRDGLRLTCYDLSSQSRIQIIQVISLWHDRWLFGLIEVLVLNVQLTHISDNRRDYYSLLSF